MRKMAYTMAKALPRLGLLLAVVLAFGMDAASASPPASDAVVSTHAGRLQGADVGDGIRAYLGIPYARPPLGALRWKAPEPASPWQDTRAARDFSPACMQPASPWDPTAEPVPQSEDCLYLNVWTPAQTSSARLPVMVWFHGGGLMVGSGSESETQGTALSRKGVIVVTVNYRLGPLGYLVLRDLNKESPHKTSGNYGLLDQIAALKWVKQNIAAFGGDPDNVTIFGFSAGSTSVSALQASPLAKGLFHKAIGESTAQMNPRAGIWHLRTFAEAENYGEEYKKSLGAANLADLRALPAAKLVQSPYKFWLVEGDGYALPQEVHDIFAEGKQAPIPVLAGATANEETTLATADMLSWLHPRTAQDEADFKRLYGEQGAHNNRSVSDVILWQMREWVRLNSLRQGRSYLYYFTRSPPSPRPGLGAYHGAEVPYVFETLDAYPWRWTAEDRKLADIVSSYWTNFARTGDPNGMGLPYWPAYGSGKIMELSSSPAAITMPRQEALNVLDGYFAREQAATPKAK